MVSDLGGEFIGEILEGEFWAVWNSEAGVESGEVGRLESGEEVIAGM